MPHLQTAKSALAAAVVDADRGNNIHRYYPVIHTYANDLASIALHHLNKQLTALLKDDNLNDVDAAFITLSRYQSQIDIIAKAHRDHVLKKNPPSVQRHIDAIKDRVELTRTQRYIEDTTRAAQTTALHTARSIHTAQQRVKDLTLAYNAETDPKERGRVYDLLTRARARLLDLAGTRQRGADVAKALEGVDKGYKAAASKYYTQLD